MTATSWVPVRESPGPLGRLGRACYRRRRLTLLTWIAGVACLITLWMTFGAPADDNYSGSDPGQVLLSQHFPRSAGDSIVLAIRSRAVVTSPAVRDQVTSALARFARAAHVTAVASPYQNPGQTSRDGHIAFATIQFGVPSASITANEATELIGYARAASGPDVTFRLGGDVVDLVEAPYGGPSQATGVAAAAVVLLAAFGSLLAMALPVLTGLFGIAAGLSLIGLIGHLFPAPSFSVIIAALIGLGVGVDYALFIVTRFREALRSGQTPQDAAVTATSTAGRSALIAGSTVVIGLLGLLLLRQRLLTGVAVAAAVTVAMTVLAALTLLPALLGCTGSRLARQARIRPPRRGRPPDGGRPPAATRWAGVVRRRPVLAAVLSTAALLGLAAPAAGMKLNIPDESAQPHATMGYQSHAIMASGFGPGSDAPLIVTAKLPTAGTDVSKIAAALRATPGVARVTSVVRSADGQAAMLIAYPATSEQDPATNALVNKIRDAVLPRATAGTAIRAYVTGPNAGNVRFADLIYARLPWLVAVVVVLAVLLLLVMFRSVTVAVTAAAMNLLSVAAAYGVLVAVTQHGWGRQLFGFSENMPITTWVPVFLFVLLFGLSMDYEVFLLSAIREEYVRTADTTGAVSTGLASTARVITAAAAIMVVVFLSVMLGANVSVKQIGLGLAAAVLIDATIVRMVLVPAVMELLGAANWWLPWPLTLLLRGASGTAATRDS